MKLKTTMQKLVIPIDMPRAFAIWVHWGVTSSAPKTANLHLTKRWGA
jgi:hypothetical protein